MKDGVKIVVSSKELYSALSKTSFANAKQDYNVPNYLYNHIFKIGSDSEIEISATDLSARVSISVKCEVDDNDGETLLYVVDTRRMRRCIKSLDEPITLKFGLSQIVVEYRKGKFYIPISETNEYPQELVQVNGMAREVVFEVPLLRKYINEVDFAMCDVFMRQTLCGVLFELGKDSSNIVASDGYMISCVGFDWLKTDREERFIVPSKTIRIMKNIMPKAGTAAMSIYDNAIHIVIEDGNEKIDVFSKTVDGKYPSYKSVFPNMFNARADVDRKELYDAIVRSDAFSSCSNIVKMILRQNEIFVESNSEEDAVSFSESVFSSTNFTEGDKMVVGFDSKRLLSVLKHLDCKFMTMCVKDKYSGVVFEDFAQNPTNSKRMMLMPKLVED